MYKVVWNAPISGTKEEPILGLYLATKLAASRGGVVEDEKGTILFDGSLGTKEAYDTVSVYH